MKPYFVLLFIQGLLLYRDTVGLNLSDFIEVCSAKDPNLNDCVKEAGQKFISKIATGNSEWNVPSVDPLLTPEITFRENTGGNDLTITYKNIVQTGFSDIIFENADIDLAHGVMTFKLKCPLIKFEADYVASGQFLGFQTHGDGRANITVWNAYNSLVLKYHVVNDHIKQNSLIFGFSFDKIFLDYTNLDFNGDKELSESTGTFINENSAEIIDRFKPELEKFYMKITGEFLQAIFDAVPYSTLFKDI